MVPSTVRALAAVVLVLALAASPGTADHDEVPQDQETTVPSDGPAYVHHETRSGAEVEPTSCAVPLVRCPWVDTVHVDEEATLYRETNGCEGLQQGASDCDGDGEPEPADEKAAGTLGGHKDVTVPGAPVVTGWLP